MIPYESSPAFWYSPARCAMASAFFASSKRFLSAALLPSFCFSACHFAVISLDSSSKKLNSDSNFSIRLLDKSSSSFLSISSSIFICIIRRSNSSSFSGFESICIFKREAASSIKSIALSGKNLSVIYLSDNSAAATRARS